jgi:hypothetical protein
MKFSKMHLKVKYQTVLKVCEKKITQNRSKFVKIAFTALGTQQKKYCDKYCKISH